MNEDEEDPQDPDVPNPFDLMHAIFEQHVEAAITQICKSNNCPVVAFDEEAPYYMANMLTCSAIMMMNAVDLHEEAMSEDKGDDDEPE